MTTVKDTFAARLIPGVSSRPMATAVGPFDIPVPDVIDLGARIDTLDRILAADNPGAALKMARTAGGDFRREFAATGQVGHASTHDLVRLPYPTKFGLWRAAVTPSPFLMITNRLVIVRWDDADGRRRTLLWEPSDYELDANTPYFAALAGKSPDVLRTMAMREYATVAERLGQAGVDPAEVDYIAFDHLHTQDVRRLIGTVTPQADISPSAPVPALFPNAKLVVQRQELEAMRDLHPLQRPWYQPETMVDLDPARIAPIDGDRLLGPGVAIVRTPGHATGNQTLVLNTETGIWAMSENVVATELLTPEHSKIPGVAGWARKWSQELILNANILESTATQYNSCVLEKTLVDRSQVDERFLQFFPTSELTASALTPGTAPTFTHRSLRAGTP
ncbi:MAG TPA: hypothetical protein VF299_09450 [Mycobacterium sp.]